MRAVLRGGGQEVWVRGEGAIATLIIPKSCVHVLNIVLFCLV